MTDASANSREFSPSSAPLADRRTVREVLEGASEVYSRMSSQFDEMDQAVDLADDEPDPYVPANWLDALPRDRYEQPDVANDRIAAVNSDEAGLYRMFLNHSP